MKKIFVGLSMLSTLLLGAGCSDTNSWADEAKKGTASFALQGGGYRLQAQIDLVGSLGGVTVNNSTTGPLDVALNVPLQPGTYAPSFDAWTLYQGVTVLGDSSQVAGPVRFVNWNPTSFLIAAGETVPITATFQVGTDQSVTTTYGGTARFVLAATTGECPVTCAVGSVCVEFNNSGTPVCAATCPVFGPDEDCPGGPATGLCLEGVAFDAGTPGVNVCAPAT